MSILRIEPSDYQVYFELSDETPESSITLTSLDPSRPVIFRIQPNQKSRYAIWPSVGVVEPGAFTIISIVLLERARFDLEQELSSMRPEIDELGRTETIVIEWCRAPEKVYSQLELLVNSDQDHDILSSFWNTKGYEFSSPAKSARQPLGVHFRLQRPQIFTTSRNPHSVENIVTPVSSVDVSSVHEDPDFACDDSMILSVSTWDAESSILAQQQQQQQRPYSGYDNTSTYLSGSVSSSNKNSTIQKFQLLQTLRCRGCCQVFSRDPNQFGIPVMSQSCGHTICRGCVIRKADQDYEFAKEYQRTVSCPLCHVADAFSQQLHINHSLCSVIALIDS